MTEQLLRKLIHDFLYKKRRSIPDAAKALPEKAFNHFRFLPSDDADEGLRLNLETKYNLFELEGFLVEFYQKQLTEAKKSDEAISALIVKQLQNVRDILLGNTVEGKNVLLQQRERYLSIFLLGILRPLTQIKCREIANELTDLLVKTTFTPENIYIVDDKIKEIVKSNLQSIKENPFFQDMISKVNDKFCEHIFTKANELNKLKDKKLENITNIELRRQVEKELDEALKKELQEFIIENLLSLNIFPDEEISGLSSYVILYYWKNLKKIQLPSFLLPFQQHIEKIIKILETIKSSRGWDHHVYSLTRLERDSIQSMLRAELNKFLETDSKEQPLASNPIPASAQSPVNNVQENVQPVTAEQKAEANDEEKVEDRATPAAQRFPVPLPKPDIRVIFLSVEIEECNRALKSNLINQIVGNLTVKGPLTKEITEFRNLVHHDNQVTEKAHFFVLKKFNKTKSGSIGEYFAAVALSKIACSQTQVGKQVAVELLIPSNWVRFKSLFTSQPYKLLNLTHFFEIFKFHPELIAEAFRPRWFGNVVFDAFIKDPQTLIQLFNQVPASRKAILANPRLKGQLVEILRLGKLQTVDADRLYHIPEAKELIYVLQKGGNSNYLTAVSVKKLNTIFCVDALLREEILESQYYIRRLLDSVRDAKEMRSLYRYGKHSPMFRTYVIQCKLELLIRGCSEKDIIEFSEDNEMRKALEKSGVNRTKVGFVEKNKSREIKTSKKQSMSIKGRVKQNPDDLAVLYLNILINYPENDSKSIPAFFVEKLKLIRAPEVMSEIVGGHDEKNHKTTGASDENLKKILVLDMNFRSHIIKKKPELLFELCGKDLATLSVSNAKVLEKVMSNPAAKAKMLASASGVQLYTLYNALEQLKNEIIGNNQLVARMCVSVEIVLWLMEEKKNQAIFLTDEFLLKAIALRLLENQEIIDESLNNHDIDISKNIRFLNSIESIFIDLNPKEALNFLLQISNHDLFLKFVHTYINKNPQHSLEFFKSIFHQSNLHKINKNLLVKTFDLFNGKTIGEFFNGLLRKPANELNLLERVLDLVLPGISVDKLSALFDLEDILLSSKILSRFTSDQLVLIFKENTNARELIRADINLLIKTFKSVKDEKMQYFIPSMKYHRSLIKYFDEGQVFPRILMNSENACSYAELLLLTEFASYILKLFAKLDVEIGRQVIQFVALKISSLSQFNKVIEGMSEEQITLLYQVLPAEKLSAFLEEELNDNSESPHTFKAHILSSPELTKVLVATSTNPQVLDMIKRSEQAKIDEDNSYLEQAETLNQTGVSVAKKESIQTTVKQKQEEVKELKEIIDLIVKKRQSPQDKVFATIVEEHQEQSQKAEPSQAAPSSSVMVRVESAR